MSFFSSLLVYGEQALPSVSGCPLFSSANVHGVDISFIIPSKLSLFPSLSFSISPVSSETDCRSCQLAFVCQRQPEPPEVCVCVKQGGQARFRMQRWVPTSRYAITDKRAVEGLALAADKLPVCVCGGRDLGGGQARAGKGSRLSTLQSKLNF